MAPHPYTSTRNHYYGLYPPQLINSANQRGQRDYGGWQVQARRPPRLPAELYSHIVEHFRDHRSDLLKLMMVSRIMHVEAERILYGYVSLFDPRAQRKFFLRILASPRLAALVRRYHFSTEHRTQQQASIEPNVTQQELALLTRALPTLYRLKDLKFHMEPEGDDCPVSIMKNCSFELEAFEWHSNCCTDDLVPFLRKRQLQGLRHLGLHTWPLNFFPRGLWPNLVSLAGEDDTIAAVLPQRNITQVRWITKISVEELRQRFRPSRSLHNVQILSFSHTQLLANEQLIAFQHLGTLFPYLQILEDVHYCVLGDSGVKAENNVMTSLHPNCFPRLRTLVLSPIRYIGYDTFRAQGFAAKKIFDTWKSISRIDIIHHLCRDVETDPDDETYERWNRGVNHKAKVTLVSANTAVWWKYSG